jgi:hypothetical protein
VVGLTLALSRRAPLRLAFGAMTMAGIVSVPFAEQHHYTLAVLPLFVVAGAWSKGQGRAAGWLLGLAAALIGLPLPYEAPALSQGALALLAYPRLYGGLLLWGLCMWWAARSGAEGSDDPGR